MKSCTSDLIEATGMFTRREVLALIAGPIAAVKREAKAPIVIMQLLMFPRSIFENKGERPTMENAWPI